MGVCGVCGRGMARAAFFLVAKFVVSAGLLWLIAGRVDSRAALAAAAGLPAAALAAALLALALQGGLLAWRWHRVTALIGARLPFPEALRLTFVGLFFNQALPSSIGGDGLRIWGACRAGVAPGLAAASVVIERASGLFALALLAALALPSVWDGLGGGPLGTVLLLVPPAAALGLALLATADRWAARRLPRALAAAAEATGAGLREIARSPRAAAEIMALGALASMAGIMGAYALGRGLGIALGPEAYFALVGGAILASALPLSIAGWGLREAAAVTLFAAVGVPGDRALSLSVLFGVAMIAVALPGGALWLAGRGEGAGAGSGAGEGRVRVERRAP